MISTFTLIYAFTVIIISSVLFTRMNQPQGSEQLDRLKEIYHEKPTGTLVVITALIFFWPCTVAIYAAIKNQE